MITQTKKGDITLLTITNASGASVTLSTIGARIVSVNVPDREGRMADVVLGYADPADYMADGPCAGKIPGRFANRIAKGRFTVGGREYQLAINNGPNALHGGPTGFQNRMWTVDKAEGDTVVLTYVSADGEEGYPAELKVTATYRWTDANELSLDLRAVTDSDTVINLTNHTYFNLSGHDSGSVIDHELWLAASRYLPTDDTLIPTGELADVTGTPMDFTSAKPLGRDIKADFPALNYGKGYDNCFVIDGADGTLRDVARLTDHVSGRTMTVATTQPGVQVYTGNWLAGSPINKSGRSYNDYEGVAIECQALPDAPNKPQFPSAVLRPGEEYHHIIVFRFN